ncbi:MAG: cation-translocating P-type ATPase, partial [Actinomycetota bacterium]|nr:cation-translocating P-type ATPase [Actinomycetota bacterium]
VLGGLLMLPGVRGRGPGPVAAAAAAALVEGRAAASSVLRRVAPAPSPAVSWHALSVQQALAAAPQVVEDTSRAGREFSRTGVAGVSLRVSQQSVRRAASVAAAIRTELSDPLTPVLAVGAAASAVLGSPVDAVLVTSVVAANAALSTFQRLRAEQQIRRLLLADAVPARRLTASALNGHAVPSSAAVTEPATTLRVGEFVEVRAGDVVPADARIVNTDGLEVDESSLTGESLPVAKSTEATPGAPLAERTCMVYEGTTVLTGSGIGLVTATGATSAAGRAAALAPDTAVGRGLQAQLGTLTAKVLPLTLAAGGAVTLTSVLRGAGLRQAVSSGVSIAVAAVPEGLPLVATLAQQAAARRLSDRDILVRTPSAVEGLGRVSVVCFDKTGTLSQNRLRVSALHAADRATSDEDLLQAAGLATQRPDPGHALNHATDAAVLDALEGTLLARDHELPFRPGRPFAAGISADRLAVKGAPETILAACELTEAQRTAVTAELARLAGAGLRILAVAERPVTPEEHDMAVADNQAFETLATANLRLLGLLGLADTSRPDAKALLAGLQSRGLGVRLITGDHPVTAAAIATELGLPVGLGQVLTGADWENLSHRDRAEAVGGVLVFARMSPEHKVQIVQELQRAGQVCAMVGDGANDAAAIRTAAVGIGVSTHGSDPARGAADIVLTNGKILPLLSALDEGQQMWHRVQAALAVLLGGNAGEVAFTLYGTALTGTAPLSARQLLLVNMLTDALPAAAVAVSPPGRGAKSLARGLDTDALIASVLIRGATTTAGASAGWTMARFSGRRRRASTVGLVALVSTQLGQTLLDSHSPLVIVTAAGSLAALAVAVSTPGVSHVLGCTPLGPLGWTQALGSATAATALAAIAPQVIERVASVGQRLGGERPGGQPRPDQRLGDDVSKANSNKQGIKTTNGRQEDHSQYTGQILRG